MIILESFWNVSETTPWILWNRLQWNLTHWPQGDVAVILQVYFFRLILQTDSLRSSSEIGLRWVAQNRIDDKWTLLQVMAWCRKATSHYPKLTQVNHDLPHHMASQGHNELNLITTTVIEENLLKSCLQNGGHFVLISMWMCYDKLYLFLVKLNLIPEKISWTHFMKSLGTHDANLCKKYMMLSCESKSSDQITILHIPQ